MLLKLLFISLIHVIVTAEKARYDNFALYKVFPQDEDSLKFLKELQKENDGLDFWKHPNKVGDYVSVVSPPELRTDFEHSLKKRNIQLELMQANIQEALDAQAYSRKKRSTSRELQWNNYQELNEIYDWFEYLSETYPSVVTVVTAGQSYEGRNINGIKISRGSNRPSFFLEGGQIGADWLSPTVLTYIADQLIRGEDPQARQASEEFDWHIFPVVNPDGFNFSQESVRLWVKNRKPITSTATGVDLSRNWNSQWGIMHASFNPADNNFAGRGPFSEDETRALSYYIESISTNLVGSLSFRSFGQRFLIPFAHSSEAMYNYNEMVTIGRRAMGSLAVKYNTQYTVGTSSDVHDGATGILADWVKFRFRTPIVATYQLRDIGTWGYTLPVSQVHPSCEETFDSVMAIIREAKFINVL